MRVYSPEEMLDVALQLASLRPRQFPRGNRVLLSTFGGGSGVIGTDQCIREGMVVPTLAAETRAQLKPLLTPLASTLNPIDMTPGSVTNPKNRANMPDVLRTLAKDDGTDLWVFFAGGFGALAPTLVDMVDAARALTGKPICLSWQAPPAR